MSPASCSYFPEPTSGVTYDNADKLILIFLILLLLGVGHAGESWDLGSLYHHHRNRQWAEEVGKQDDEVFAKVETYHRQYSPEQRHVRGCYNR